jgi:hypothetical protein
MVEPSAIYFLELASTGAVLGDCALHLGAAPWRVLSPDDYRALKA